MVKRTTTHSPIAGQSACTATTVLTHLPMCGPWVSVLAYNPGQALMRMDAIAARSDNHRFVPAVRSHPFPPNSHPPPDRPPCHKVSKRTCGTRQGSYKGPASMSSIRGAEYLGSWAAWINPSVKGRRRGVCNSMVSSGECRCGDCSYLSALGSLVRSRMLRGRVHETGCHPA